MNPIDGKNLNKAFPGNASGSATEKLARIITDQIIRHSDIFLDIHGGDASEDLLPFVCYYDNPQHPKETELAARLCQASGMENVVSYTYRLKKSDAAQYAFKQAVQDGKVALSIEAGKLGTVQEASVKTIKSGVYGILDDAEVYENNQKISIGHRNYFKDQSYVKSSSDGIFHSSFKAGDVVRKGQELGYVTDVFGKQIEKFSAPADGVILYKIGTPPVKKDETVFCIGIK